MKSDGNYKTSQRIIVVPGELIAEGKLKIGSGAYSVDNRIYSEYLGIKSVKDNVVSVIPLNGKYNPKVGEMVIGYVENIAQSNWMVNINSIYPAMMLASDVPWRVGSNKLQNYIDIGEAIIAYVSEIDEVKHIRITMKSREFGRKIEDGITMTIPASKVPRVIGKSGSMISMIKDLTGCRIIVGMNGIIWLNGEKDNLAMAVNAVKKIDKNAQISGLTDNIKNMIMEWKNGISGDVDE